MCNAYFQFKKRSQKKKSRSQVDAVSVGKKFTIFSNIFQELKEYKLQKLRINSIFKKKGNLRLILSFGISLFVKGRHSSGIYEGELKEGHFCEK